MAEPIPALREHEDVGGRRHASGFLFRLYDLAYRRELMSYVMVDVEADGPIPGDYSMICLGAVVVEPALERTFYATLKPISERWLPDALSVSGFSREQTQAFDEPEHSMRRFAEWLEGLNTRRLVFISDNNGFDWQFVNFYFHHFLGKNPFGFSSQNLGSLYKGLVKDSFASFKHLRKTAHTHDPVDDARGNAEALLHMQQELGLKISFY
jgi:DNA polymerase III epsilon subunit-like protein